jgi:uncharacterized protein with HEPN domain
MKRSIMSLKDILESMNRIDTYIFGVEYDSFLSNQMLIDAVIRNLEVIGEAARNVSDEIRNKYPKIPWRNMIGLRNILIHQYFGVDEGISTNIVSVRWIAKDFDA